MIAVVDYCKGNLKSVERGLIAAGGDARITDDPDVIVHADAVVLPGVGAFADASKTMCQTGQMEAIRSAIADGTPFLGICLGEHLLFSDGVEGALGPGKDGELGAAGLPEGLGVLSGTVCRMSDHDSAGRAYKVPHVGWNSIEFDPYCNCPLLDGVRPGEYFYFTHSYVAPNSDATVATTTHSDAGTLVLRNFLNIVRNAR